MKCEEKKYLDMEGVKVLLDIMDEKMADLRKVIVEDIVEYIKGILDSEEKE